MASEQGLLQCYNRGCGKKFSPESNTDDACRHHPGAPVFHDAYKGWSCCNKKCTDFTEFLNIKGCTVSKHSNNKPPEPQVQKPVTVPDEEIIQVKPIERVSMPRPPLDTALVTMVPQIAPSLKQQLESLKVIEKTNSDEIAVGTVCKNGGCNTSYEGPQTNDSVCVHHPGIPIFHEGMKFWSCCQKRTTDFNSFLSQVGCERGKHAWKSANADDTKVQCRWDHHQTGTHVIVSVYAKKYCPNSSFVKLNPVRMFISLVFPESGNAKFEMDSELFGIVNVDASEVAMYGTKVEVKLKKAEPVSWGKLEVKRLNQVETKKEEKANKEKDTTQVSNISKLVKGVDLSKDVDLSDL